MPESFTGPGVFKRFLLGALLIVLAAAGATSVAAWHEVDKVIQAFQGTKPIAGIEKIIDKVPPGAPQTLLLMGSDQRNPNAVDVKSGAYARNQPHSDTMILVRLDADKKATALLSLPRDLKVRIPGHGVSKLNDAFTLGGPKLTVRTIKGLTGLHINHVVVVDFHGFATAVNALGCVYVDVDRRYYNTSNAYAKINIPPGYQRLCGQDALSYVRFRHEDNDLVRATRQQDFLRQIKQQVGTSGLIDNRDALLQVFSKHTSSDLRGRGSILQLLALAVASAGNPIREVKFPARLGPSYVYASRRMVQKTVEEFLGLRGSSGPKGVLEPKGRKARRRARIQAANLETTRAGRDQALQAINQKVRVFPVYYPTKRLRGSLFGGPPRVYEIVTRDNKRFAAYRIVIKRGLVGEYYGVQGTTWKNPPILSSPSETRTIRGRRFDLFYDGTRLRLVAWRERGAVYWLSNTLLLSLDDKQMLSIASSTRHL
jgi:LCP family protein required for cell wall assembly